MLITTGEYCSVFLLFGALVGAVLWGIAIITPHKNGGILWVVMVILVFWLAARLVTSSHDTKIRLVDAAFLSHKNGHLEVGLETMHQPSDEEIERLFGMALRRHRLALHQITTVKQPNSYQYPYRVTLSWRKEQPFMPRECGEKSIE